MGGGMHAFCLSSGGRWLGNIGGGGGEGRDNGVVCVCGCSNLIAIEVMYCVFFGF